MTFEMFQLSETINEVGIELRTMWASRHLPPRLGALKSLNMDGLGNAILDDRLMIDPITGTHHSVFLFQTMLFCCRERTHASDGSGGGYDSSTRYPTKPWEVGCALSQECGLMLVHAIPTTNIKTLHCIDEGK
jgi:hypothetical protein